jgi:lysophospholipase L1-like esterase
LISGLEGPRSSGGVLGVCLLLVVPVLPCSAWAAAPIHEIDLTGNPVARHSLPVSEGNYRVTVRLGGPKGESAAILAEQRRLMVEGLRLQGSRPVETTFMVNVRGPALDAPPENAPGGSAVRLKTREVGSATWDELLTIEVSGPASLRWLRVEAARVPTLYLAGDSTVTDQAMAPSASWGQFLPRYFAAGIAVANHAESGETLKSFVTGLRLDKLLSKLRAGDWVMIQFGHNDQKAQWPQTHAEAATTYRSWLRTYIAEIRRRGATAILVTSPERRNFDAQGRIVPSLGAYPEAVRAVALEEGVALIDLHPMSIRFYESLGPQRAPSAFADGGRDKTHHNEYGARCLARMVVEGLRATDPSLSGALAAHLAADAGRFDPANPPSEQP